MKALKRLLCTLLILSMIACMTVTGASAATRDFIIGTVKIDGPFGSDWPEQTYYYNNDYFRTSGKELNVHLASLSALSTFYLRNASDDPETEFTAILEHIGFSDFAVEELDLMKADSIGTLIGQKNVDGVPVIAVMIRGDDYETEWASNFLAGFSGDMTGFSDAAQKVSKRIHAYLMTRGMKSAKYWVCGYSRSGAVANLVGKTLNENLGTFETTEDNIYVYTYETPRCTDSSVAYENIHNFIDGNDLIPAVYPAVWPAERNGIDVQIGDNDATIMSKTFILAEPYFNDLHETNLSAFVREFSDLLGENIDRQTYAKVLEKPVSELVEMFFSLSDEEQTALTDFAKIVGANIQENPNMVSTMIQVLFNTTADTTVDSVVKLLTDSIDAAVESEGKPIGDENFGKITAVIRPLVQVLMPVVKADLITEFEDGESANFYHLSTMIANAGEIITYHYNYNVFERLKAMDSYYVKRITGLLGDADGNGLVDIVDVTYIQRYLVDLYPLDDLAKKYSDVDFDGEVSIDDATWIQRFDVELEAPEGIGQPI